MLGRRNIPGKTAPNQIAPVHIGCLDDQLTLLLLAIFHWSEGHEKVCSFASVLGELPFFGLDRELMS
jgi:hypothetical protein